MSIHWTRIHWIRQQQLKLIEEYLAGAGIAYQSLDGSTPAKARAERIAVFQAGQGEVFLISFKAGGVGLNLTAADYVIHMDPWWNPAAEDQASDRAHRIGRTRPVTIYRLVAKGTIWSGPSRCTTTSVTWPSGCWRARALRLGSMRASCWSCCAGRLREPVWGIALCGGGVE